MARFLVFTLTGPLMAFGDVAPGERRVGLDRPGRSALLGLLAAALGLRREDARHDGLAKSIAFAVRVDAVGEAVIDYHTTQTAPARRNRRFATRREELAVADLGTILSRRAYRADAAFTIVVLRTGEGPFALAALAAALARPELPIHAGRRSCPLGLPPNPQLIEADDAPAALAAYDSAEDATLARAELRRTYRLGGKPGATLATEVGFENLLGTAQVTRHESRRDDPVSRTRWQFALRIETIAKLANSP